MKIIGLMGGVGSGKSTVADILKEEYHAHLIITDDIARDLCNKGQESYNRIVAYFGREILKEDGEIDRNKLSGIVFNNEEKLKKLNSFTHPLVKEYVIREITMLKDRNARAVTEEKEEPVPYLVIETALLIDAGYRELCDEVWYVAVDENIRKERLIKSRGYTEEKIMAILKNQMSDTDFSDNCDIILYNNGNLSILREQIQFLLVSN
ncbi:dephospho-CoA kinase [Anaerosporobacter faecicola]|uniref:dephospho-CoA kinase n=1 Tax=Anaerosporobacter faecicola TaxID=2718714 RepID=UPI00143A937C|nr:dephospho-CoA kinase [Anaerosporobacter faecicola]